jgi:quercetin dioxygenase-like cupin family protein
MTDKVKVLRNLERNLPDGDTARVRNYRARRELGSKSTTVFENILGIKAYVPWHTHPEAEEIVVAFEGEGECETEAGVERFSAGDTVIVPAGVMHTFRSVGATPLRVFTAFPVAEVKTVWRDPISSAGNTLRDANTKG